MSPADLRPPTAVPPSAPAGPSPGFKSLPSSPPAPGDTPRFASVMRQALRDKDPNPSQDEPSDSSEAASGPESTPAPAAVSAPTKGLTGRLLRPAVKSS